MKNSTGIMGREGLVMYSLACFLGQGDFTFVLLCTGLVVCGEGIK